jgi:hypothetical protein
MMRKEKKICIKYLFGIKIPRFLTPNILKVSAKELNTGDDLGRA